MEKEKKKKRKRYKNSLTDIFTNISRYISSIVGSPFAFIIAALIILVWLISGPYFGYSDTWQLIINTGTTIVTFLMVFIIQNAQNRDSRSIELKLDELLKEMPDEESNEYINIEDLTEEELEFLGRRLKHLRKRNQEEQ